MRVVIYTNTELVDGINVIKQIVVRKQQRLLSVYREQSTIGDGSTLSVLLQDIPVKRIGVVYVWSILELGPTLSDVTDNLRAIAAAGAYVVPIHNKVYPHIWMIWAQEGSWCVEWLTNGENS